MSASTTTPQALEYVTTTTPQPGEWRDVCAGISWLRMPLPFALNHVNCWLLGEPGNQVLIDTGVSIPSTHTYWQQALGIHSNETTNVPETLVVTHFHPDHMGMAGWFAEAGSQLLGSQIEVELAHAIWHVEDSQYGDFYADWYHSHGLPQSTIDAVRGKGNTYRKIVGQPPSESSWTYLLEGQTVELGGEAYHVMTGRGHAPDMIMLYRERDHVLIAADQVLPNITPNVSVMPRLEDPDPLSSFLTTLEYLKQLPSDTLVLPSHGIPFRGLHTRLDFLASHHDDRLSEVLDACVGCVSAHDLFKVLFHRELDAQQMSFALGESLAHLHYLENRNQLARVTSDGAVRFQRV